LQGYLEDIIHRLQYMLVKERLENWRQSQGDDLLRGMWIVATYQYPDLSLEKLSQELEQLYYEVWLEHNPEAHPYDQIKFMNSVMFSKLKFRGNTRNFHAPANSMINMVLETRRGNPISLAVDKDEREQFYINAFNRGLIFSRQDIDNYIAQINLTPRPMFYEPCSHADIVVRTLRNLSIAFEKLDEHSKAEEVKELIKILEA